MKARFWSNFMTGAHPRAWHSSRTNRIALESSANTPPPRPRFSRTTKDRSGSRLIVNSSGGKSTLQTFVTAVIASSFIALRDVNFVRGSNRDRRDPADSSAVRAVRGCGRRHSARTNNRDRQRRRFSAASFFREIAKLRRLACEGCGSKQSVLTPDWNGSQALKLSPLRAESSCC